MYANPHLPLDDTWRVEEGDATADDERVDDERADVVKDERVALELERAVLDRTTIEDDDNPEQVPNFELQPVPQYALELPQYEYWEQQLPY